MKNRSDVVLSGLLRDEAVLCGGMKIFNKHSVLFGTSIRFSVLSEVTVIFFY